ncbi:MAG: hypothetical protein HY721_03390 [Planctomycetes bacterium]|nr:hypothetical protein [Planctomycetota bacterium]
MAEKSSPIRGRGTAENLACGEAGIDGGRLELSAAAFRSPRSRQLHLFDLPEGSR